MALRRSLPTQPRRVIHDSTPPTDSPPASRRSRFGRGTLAVATAGAVGVLTFCVPGVAHSVTHQEATRTAPAAAVPSGSGDAFASRQDTTSRSRTRQAIARDVATAAAARADALADTAEDVAHTQTVAGAEARAQSLADTRARIGAEAERLANADRFFWPTKGGIASEWGMRMHPILRYKRLHGGADIGGAPGAPIYAVLDGTVTRAATGYNSGSGNNVRINHGQVNGERLETTYLHMASLSVASGERVKRGQLIGTVGSTGLSTAPPPPLLGVRQRRQLRPRPLPPTRGGLTPPDRRHTPSLLCWSPCPLDDIDPSTGVARDVDRSTRVVEPSRSRESRALERDWLTSL